MSEQKEYIEKEAAKKCITPRLCDDKGVLYWGDAREAIDSIPPADVRPVVRGEWISVSESAWDGNEYKCSACGWTCSDNEFSDDPTEDYRFCPNCGADMRKEKQDVHQRGN